VVRQSAGDIVGHWQDSLLNAQYPERLARLKALAESRGPPSGEGLDGYWMTLLEDLAASGRVERVDLPVVGLDGQRKTQPVLRVGTFSSFGEAGLRHDAEAGELLAAANQPSGRGQVTSYLESGEALAELPGDPTRGTLLAQLQREPDFWTRLQPGGLVGWVIVALGAFGLCLAAWRMIHLGGVARSIKAQLQDLGTPRSDNPLGLVKLISAVAPQLGLLGTVSGMIAVFDVLALSGAGNPRGMAAATLPTMRHGPGYHRCALSTAAGHLPALVGQPAAPRVERAVPVRQSSALAEPGPAGAGVQESRPGGADARRAGRRGSQPGRPLARVGGGRTGVRARTASGHGELSVAVSGPFEGRWDRRRFRPSYWSSWYG